MAGYDNIKKYTWRKGQSGNPSGGGKIAKGELYKKLGIDKYSDAEIDNDYRYIFNMPVPLIKQWAKGQAIEGIEPTGLQMMICKTLGTKDWQKMVDRILPKQPQKREIFVKDTTEAFVRQEVKVWKPEKEEK